MLYNLPQLLINHLPVKTPLATTLAVEGHLALSHIPSSLLLVGIALVLYGRIKKKDDFISAGLVVFGVSALLSIAVFILGHLAHEVVEELPGFKAKSIASHKTAGTITLVIMIFLLGIVAYAKQKFKEALYTSSFTYMVLFLSLVALLSFGNTQKLGGAIRHTELSGNSSPATALDKHHLDEGHQH